MIGTLYLIYCRSRPPEVGGLLRGVPVVSHVNWALAERLSDALQHHEREAAYSTMPRPARARAPLYLLSR